MKKQLLIAAVAASMTATTMADISISGSGLVGAAGGSYSQEADLTVTGTSGATTLVATISLDEDQVEDLYLTSSVAGVALKVGEWESGASELGAASTGAARVNASTSFGGIKLTYEDRSGAAGTSVAMAGEVSGISLMHKINDGSSETKVSGSMGGINAAVHTKDSDATGANTSVTLSTEVQGMTLTYVDVTTNAATSMDGYIGEYAGVTSATAYGVSTEVSGNTVELKQVSVTGATNVDQLEITVTRDLGNGATLEASYNDADSELGLELSYSF
ncbi:MAG: hypothetical protein NZ824_00300 [Candidatus Thioglobus sp.]|nr:hypothetical protein [Candidatus Thioglobus sp.]